MNMKLQVCIQYKCSMQSTITQEDRFKSRLHPDCLRTLICMCGCVKAGVGHRGYLSGLYSCLIGSSTPVTPRNQCWPVRTRCRAADPSLTTEQRHRQIPHDRNSPTQQNPHNLWLTACLTDWLIECSVLTLGLHHSCIYTLPLFLPVARYVFE